MKVVINTDFGGFGLSSEAMERVLDLKRITYYKETDKYNNVHFYTKAQNANEVDNQYICEYDLERDDPALIQAVEEFKEKANGRYSDLKVVEIPDDVDWVIHEYDGREHIAEKHRTWA